MATPVGVVNAAGAPGTAHNVVNVTLIMTILSAALQALGNLAGPVGTDSALAGTFLSIVQNAMAAYKQATGQPLDLTKIPMEALVP